MAKFLWQFQAHKYFVQGIKSDWIFFFPDSQATFIRNQAYSAYVDTFIFCLQGDVGLPGPPGPPPSTGILEFMGFPKGKQGEKVCKYNLQTLPSPWYRGWKNLLDSEGHYLSKSYSFSALV